MYLSKYLTVSPLHSKFQEGLFLPSTVSPPAAWHPEGSGALCLWPCSADAKAMPPSRFLPAPNPRPSMESARLEPRRGGFRDESSRAAGGVTFYLEGGAEKGKRRPTTKRTRRGQGARTGSGLGRGTASTPSPFRRTPSVPLPHRCRRARPPPSARPGSASPRRRVPVPPPARGRGSTSHPHPLLTCGCRLAAVWGGIFHSPFPGGSEFTTYFPTPSRGGGRASFSSVWQGGENQCHLANCPRLPFPRQSGPPLAA